MEMATYRRWVMAGFLIAVCLSFPGCENAQKTGAQMALDAAQRAVDSFNGSEAAQFLPAQARDIQSTLQAGKESFAKGDYSGALAAAKSLPSKVKEASEAWTVKKQELDATFSAMNAKMPALSAAVQARIDALQKSHKLPPGVADGYAQFKTTWADASAAFQSGNYSVAIATASAAQNQLARVQSALVSNQ
jgi:hypothetical protein